MKDVLATTAMFFSFAAGVALIGGSGALFLSLLV
jgi:hypothetical protein